MSGHATRHRVADPALIIEDAVNSHESADCIDHTAEGECIFPHIGAWVIDYLNNNGWKVVPQ